MHGTEVLQAMLGSSIIFAGNITLDCTSIAITPFLPLDTSVNYAYSILNNGSFGDAETNLLFPMNATNLPELCAISINVISSTSSNYNFGIFLPKVWNHRTMTVGNGGFGGGINWLDMGRYAHYGFATISTDTGHSSNVFDGSWALDNPETIIDWGYRAMHGSVDIGKQIVEAYYGTKSNYNYYAACSTGGRQGLREIQLYPDDFDGIVVGAPAWWSNHLQPWTVHIGMLNLPIDGPNHVPKDLYKIVLEEIYRQCDPQDGLKDGIIMDPDGCNLFLENLLCTTSKQDSCLTSSQIETIYKIYSDYVDANQTFVFPHIALGSDPTVFHFSSDAPSPLGTTFVEHFILNDTTWDWRNYDYKIVQLADQINPGNATAWDFDLSSYQNRGGKVIMYHGLEDAGIPVGSSTFFYKQVMKKMNPKGKNLDDFFRLFLVPGMGHCGGSQNAPWYIAGGLQMVGGVTHGVPGYEDGKHDAILAIMQWVEKGIAPDELIATRFVDDDVTKGVDIQRPLCVYPKQAKYLKGEVREASSWECRNLY